MQGPVLDLPRVAIGSTHGDPRNVDLEAAAAKGIPCFRTRRNGGHVAELAVGLILGIEPRARFRRVTTSARARCTGTARSRTSVSATSQLAGRAAASSGSALRGTPAAGGSRASACRSSPAAPSPRATHTLDDLLAEADMVSMHAAVTPDTLGLMSAERFGLMQAENRLRELGPGRLHDLDALTAAPRAAASPGPRSTTSRAGAPPPTSRCWHAQRLRTPTAAARPDERTTPRDRRRARHAPPGRASRPTSPSRRSAPMADTTAPEVTSPTTTPGLPGGREEDAGGRGSSRARPATSPAACPSGWSACHPSSVAYDTMTLEDLVVVDLAAQSCRAAGRPTTEKDLHLAALLPLSGARGMIHAHAMYATMFALAHGPSPGDRGGGRVRRGRRALL